MQTISQPQALLKKANQCRAHGSSIALVPTMGALHDGHLALLQHARQTHDQLFCSIFVNPIQFDTPQDLHAYPTTLDDDRQLLENIGCDILFQPRTKDMYPQQTHTQFAFNTLATRMEGTGRPGHFHGVALVLCKLFHLSLPHSAFFGQKDWQQCRIVQQLTTDLSFDIQIHILPTVRNSHGLACSSRNKRLRPKAQQQATILYQTLKTAQRLLLEGQTPAAVKVHIAQHVRTHPYFLLEYFDMIDSLSLQPIQYVKEHKYISLCIAGQIEGIRLLDNIFLHHSPIIV